MVARSKIEIPVYYDEEKKQWLVDENYTSLLEDASKIIDAIERKYVGYVYGWDGYWEGLVEKDVANKLEEAYPGFWEPDSDFFSNAFEETGYCLIEKTLKELWEYMIKHDEYKDLSYEDFLKSIDKEVK